MSISTCFSYGCADEVFGDFYLNDCNKTIPGGTNGGYILECNHTITDPSNETQLAANVAAGLATWVPGSTITIEKPTANTIESGVSCKPPQLVGYDRTGTYYNDNVNFANIAQHNIMFGGKKIGGLLWRQCGAADRGEDRVVWIDAEITITGGRILPQSNKEAQRFEGDISWSSFSEPLDYDTPTNWGIS